MLDWREEGQPLTGQEAKGVQEGVERVLRDRVKESRPIPIEYGIKV